MVKFVDAAARQKWIDDMKARKAAKASGTTKSVKAPGKPAKVTTPEPKPAKYMRDGELEENPSKFPQVEATKGGAGKLQAGVKAKVAAPQPHANSPKKGKRKSAPVAAKVPVKKGGKVAQSKPVAAKSKAPATPVAKKLTPPPAMVAAPIHTMERSYLRSGAPGAGMLRGKNYQATVTFTEEQFLKLRDKASFNNRSLAEQIRWSVIQQQAK